MLDLLRTVQIMLGEPGMILFGYVAVLTCIGFDRRCLPPEIGIGIDHQLEDQCRTSLIADHLRDDCGEIAARAIAAKGDPGGVAIELNCMPGNPLCRGVTSVGGCWKCVFGR